MTKAGRWIVYAIRWILLLPAVWLVAVLINAAFAPIVQQPEKHGFSSEVGLVASIVNLLLVAFAYVAVAAWAAPVGKMRTAIVMAVLLIVVVLYGYIRGGFGGSITAVAQILIATVIGISASLYLVRRVTRERAPVTA